MQGYFGLAAVALFIIMVLIRGAAMNGYGMKAFVFGQTDKRDFFLIPAVLLVFYQLLAFIFPLPKLFGNSFVNALWYPWAILRWFGVAVCFLSAAFFFLSLVSFGSSFRVGVDIKRPDKLVTTGMFSISRNPLYLAFLALFLGLLIIFPSLWFTLVLIAAFLVLNRQISVEEHFLRTHYGQAYHLYCRRVRRYI